MIQCKPDFSFPSIGKRHVTVDLNGGNITSDSGAIWLRQLDRRLHLIDKLAGCIHDPRDPVRVRHTTAEMLRQRIFQIALGYEDANDADTLRIDPMLKAACERLPDDADLASQPSLSRLENRITPGDIQRLLESLVDLWLAHRPRPKNGRLILDVDATDDETHGQQEFTGFHAYYGHYCFLPLLIHDGETGDLIVPLLRPGRVGTKLGADGLLLYLAERIRKKWPDVQVLVRGDAGFCGEEFYAQLEAADVDYVLGLARNSRLQKLAEPLMKPVRLVAALSEHKACAFGWGEYAAASWSKTRDVVVKAERLIGKDNPRFLVTTLDGDAEKIYREIYCLRADRSENRIKDLMNGCKADRLSCHRFTANFFRLILHSAAYQLLHHLRQALNGTPLAKAEIQTIRLKALKIGGRIRQTCRRVWLHLATGCPYQDIWEHLYRTLVEA